MPFTYFLDRHKLSSVLKQLALRQDVIVEDQLTLTVTFLLVCHVKYSSLVPFSRF